MSRDREWLAVDALLRVINAAHPIFRKRHNWLSPLTTDEERRQFIADCCAWWNETVCPTMDRIGAIWSERQQQFGLGTREKR